jgi:hypothetical protein
MTTTTVHLCFSKAVEAPTGVDLRTRAGRDAEVLSQVETYKGFSVFWATENQKRAHAIGRMEASGGIVGVPGSAFPWCGYKIGTGEPPTPSTEPPEIEGLFYMDDLTND